MKPIRHVNDLLELALNNACSRAAEKAIRYGTYTPPVELTLPWGNHAWKFTVRSNSKAEWLFVIELREKERNYRVRSEKVK